MVNADCIPRTASPEGEAPTWRRRGNGHGLLAGRLKNAGYKARTTSKANWSAFLPDAKHALAAASGVRPPDSIARKVRQIDDVVDEGPSDSHQLSHRCRGRRLSCRLAAAVKRCKCIQVGAHEGSHEAATSAHFRWAHICKSRKSGFGRDSSTNVLQLALLRASLINYINSS